MMAAQSATWSYLKRAWNNDLAFERASRSLAKTGSRLADDGKRLELSEFALDVALPTVTS